MTIQTISPEIQKLIDAGRAAIAEAEAERERRELEAQARIDAAWETESALCIAALPDALRPYARIDHRADEPPDMTYGVRYVTIEIPGLTEIVARVSIPERQLVNFTNNGGQLGTWRIDGSWADKYLYRDDLSVALALAQREDQERVRRYCPRCHPGEEGELCEEHAAEEQAWRDAHPADPEVAASITAAIAACEVQYLTSPTADPAVDHAEGEAPA